MWNQLASACSRLPACFKERGYLANFLSIWISSVEFIELVVEISLRSNVVIHELNVLDSLVSSEAKNEIRGASILNGYARLEASRIDCSPRLGNERTTNTTPTPVTKRGKSLYRKVPDLSFQRAQKFGVPTTEYIPTICSDHLKYGLLHHCLLNCAAVPTIHGVLLASRQDVTLPSTPNRHGHCQSYPPTDPEMKNSSQYHSADRLA